MVFPDPVLIHIMGWPIRWYGLSYLVGIWLAFSYMGFIAQKSGVFHKKDVDQFLPWAVIGILLGGRLGYVFFYDPMMVWQDPVAIFKTWEGGMAFHGGFLGVVMAFTLFCWRHHLHMGRFADILAMGAPIGIFFGRLGNFINQEAFGRVTDVPWGVVFPKVDPLVRHPSQLYEAFLEGLFLWFLLYMLRPYVQRKPWLLSAVFLFGYGACRWLAELYRFPDGVFCVSGLCVTYGQFLSFPMLVIGGVMIIIRARSL